MKLAVMLFFCKIHFSMNNRVIPVWTTESLLRLLVQKRAEFFIYVLELTD